jgi:hypothetical protein
MLNCRPVALVTPAVMYGLALFQSSVATKITAAIRTTQKIETTQIKARRILLAIKKHHLNLHLRYIKQSVTGVL